MKTWVKQNKGLITVVCTMIGCTLTIIKPMYYLVETGIVIREDTQNNTENIEKILEYKEESEKARVEVVKAVAVMSSQMETIIKNQEDHNVEFTEYKKEMEENTEKFYRLNSHLKNHRFSEYISPLVPHYVHEYELLYQGGSN